MKRQRLFFVTVILVSILMIPFNTASAASNVNKLVQDAVNAGKVLKWAISIEGSGDGKTRPWQQYNAAKDAYQKALSAVNSDEQLEKLEQEVALHIERAMHYIDAITAGEKINEQKAVFESLLATEVLSDELEQSYHKLSAELRKQGILLDRVYGKSTRDLIRSQYKYSAEDALNAVKYAITAKMKLDQLEPLLEAGNLIEASIIYQSVKELLSSVETENFKEQVASRLASLDSLYEIEKFIEENQIEEAPDEEEPEKVVLTLPEIKAALTNEAIKRNIPPEILKGVALTENGKLQQFNVDGTPLISFDGGIGIMQVTLPDSDNSYDKERLKYDTLYNIQAGADILLEKWKYGGRRIPTVNDNDMNVLENWYFAIMAYNGLLQRNDPSLSPTTYQQRVYANISRYAQVNIDVPNEPLDIFYNDAGQQLFTNKMHYQTERKTYSSQVLKPGNTKVLANNSRLRQEPNTSGGYEVIPAGLTVEILEGPIEDNSNYANLFTWYKVRVNETGQIGYIASSNLY